MCEERNKNEHPGPLQCGEVDGDRSSSTTDPASLSDNGNSDKERACSCEDIDRDYGARAESVAAGILGDSSDSLQSSFEGESAAPSCGKEREETDRAQALICEAQQSAEGPVRAVQEEGCSLLRADEDQGLELSESAAGDMGITQSADTPESSEVESCSQGEESPDENDVGSGNSSSLEQEEIKGINEHSAMDQSGNGEQESNKAAGLFISADIIHSVEDKHEINVSQTSDSFEPAPEDQEKIAKSNTDAQERGKLDTFCHDTETESSHEQFDRTCHHRQESDTTPEETCQENDVVGECQTLLDAETSQHSSGDTPVTLNTVSQNSSQLPELKPEAATGEPDSTVISETTAGSESEGQLLECSTAVSLAALGSEPGSSTPSSEDAVKPEETEQLSANMVQRDSSTNLQEVSQQSSLGHDHEHTQVSGDIESRVSLKNDNGTEEISLKNGDGLPEAGDVLPLKNSDRVPDFLDIAVHPNALGSEGTVELRSSDDRLIKEEVQPCLGHSEAVLCSFSTVIPADIVDGSPWLDGQPRFRVEPEVLRTDSTVTALTEEKERQEAEHEEDVDGHIKTHQEGENEFSFKSQLKVM